jgi:hypothetical protein
VGHSEYSRPGHGDQAGEQRTRVSGREGLAAANASDCLSKRTGKQTRKQASGHAKQADNFTTKQASKQTNTNKRAVQRTNKQVWPNKPSRLRKEPNMRPALPASKPGRTQATQQPNEPATRCVALCCAVAARCRGTISAFSTRRGRLVRRGAPVSALGTPMSALGTPCEYSATPVSTRKP